MKNHTLAVAVSCLSLLISNCTSTDPAKISQKSYDKQMKDYVATLQKQEAPSIAGVPKSIWTPTVNFNLRKPNYVIIHHTAQDSLAQTIKTFRTVKTQVSAHYTIGHNGEIVQMLNDYLRAWHGGKAVWAKNSDINSVSIGIELDNNGFEPFSDAQINSLLLLLEKLKKEYNIPTTNFIGHSDIAPGRKTDPSALFPWEKLASKGFNVWKDAVLEPAPETLDVVLALKVIGYDTSNLSAAIKSFKLHYIQSEVNDVVDDKFKSVLYNIVKKQ